MKKVNAKVKQKSKQRSKRKKLGKGATLFLTCFAVAILVVVIYLFCDAFITAMNKKKMAIVPVEIEVGGPGSGSFAEPRDVATDKTENFYVTDFNRGTVQKFDLTGKLLMGFGKPGEHSADEKGPGEFKEPSGIWVDSDGNIYVADTFNQRIQKFDSKGKSLKIWAHGFFGPRDVVGNNNGKIYVVDTGNHKVQVFDTSGNFLMEWGGRGSGVGKFDEPVGCAIDSKGFVYVADSNNNRIEKFDEKGKFVSSFKVSLWHGKNDEVPYLAISADSIYASNASGSSVLRFDLNGKLIAIYKKQDGFSAASGVAVDDKGRVYIVEKGINRVARFTPPSLPQN